MNPQKLVVCYTCDESIDLGEYVEKDTDICPNCNGKMSNKGEVTILEVWTKEQAYGTDCRGGTCE